MPNYVAPSTAVATLVNGVWEIDFPTEQNGRAIYRITFIGGPSGGTVDLYIDNNFISTINVSDKNAFAPYESVQCARGQQPRLVWSIGSGSAPTGTLYATVAYNI